MPAIDWAKFGFEACLIAALIFRLDRTLASLRDEVKALRMRFDRRHTT